MLGFWLEIEFIMFIGVCSIATGILLIISAIAGHGKSESEKREIEKDISDKFYEGTTRGFRYTMFKMTMNDKINKDIKNDITDGINRSSRH